MVTPDGTSHGSSITVTHRVIIETLQFVVMPGWKVFDIGGGGGLLALSLVMCHSDFVILEPSWAMRDLVAEEIIKNKMYPRISVNKSR